MENPKRPNLIPDKRPGSLILDNKTQLAVGKFRGGVILSGAPSAERGHTGVPALHTLFDDAETQISRIGSMASKTKDHELIGRLELLEKEVTDRRDEAAKAVLDNMGIPQKKAEKPKTGQYL